MKLNIFIFIFCTVLITTPVFALTCGNLFMPSSERKPCITTEQFVNESSVIFIGKRISQRNLTYKILKSYKGLPQTVGKISLKHEKGFYGGFDTPRNKIDSVEIIGANYDIWGNLKLVRFGECQPRCYSAQEIDELIPKRNYYLIYLLSILMIAVIYVTIGEIQLLLKNKKS